MAWIGYWSLLAIATHIPIDREMGARIPVSDPVIHAVVFAVLAVLGGWRVVTKKRGGASQRLVLWAGVYAIYGALDEWLQPYTGRTASLTDWLADIIGVLSGTGLVFLVSGTLAGRIRPPV
jgi:hypothetical protein